MIKNELKRYSKDYLATLSDKSKKTVDSYTDGLYVLELFFNNYFEGDSLNLTIGDIEPSDIDHILSYFVIRKFFEGVTFRVNSAKTIKAFFRYLAARGHYDKSNAKEIAKISDHYKEQYPRLEKLESSLWNETEGEMDEMMKLPKKRQEQAIAKLKAAAVGSKLWEVGYVSVSKIEKEMIYGKLVPDGKESIGPVRISANSQALVQVGDIINMITLRKMKGDTAWEIVELGYVYPKSFYGSDAHQSIT